MTAADPPGARDDAASERKIIQRGLYFEEFEENVVYIHSTLRETSEAKCLPSQPGRLWYFAHPETTD